MKASGIAGFTAVLLAWTSCARETLAHPGSGIVVDSQGQVFFQDSAARTIWKVDTQNRVTAHYDKMGGHWMALDEKGHFARSNLKLVERITSDGHTPALIVADGGAPITVNTDGNLYYGASFSNDEVIVGMMRISPDGSQHKFAPEFGRAVENLGVTGLTNGPDGTLYAACLTKIMKVRPDGSFSTFVDSIQVKDCDTEAPTSFLRGLGMNSGGTLY